MAWLYATAANPRAGAIFRKSLVLFVLPILLWPGGMVRSYIGMWAVVACEEALKALASTREQRQIDRFWLVTLFGIWELVLDKSLLGLILGRDVAAWTGFQIAGLLYATALPALMHAVTAGIYAFTLR